MTVEVDVLDPPSLTALTLPVNVKQHCNETDQSVTGLLPFSAPALGRPVATAGGRMS